MRVPFSEVFDTTGGRIRPKVSVKIGIATMSPSGSMSPSAIVSGVNLGALVGHDLEVEQDGQVLVLKGNY